jgi:hypothetical protein
VAFGDRMRPVKAVPVTCVLLVAMLNGCGSGGSTKTAASRPSCSQFCQQAGPEGGPNPTACPAQSGICPSCPAGGCLDLLSSTARVRDGVFSVKVHCRLARTCAGAFLVYQPNLPETNGGNHLPMSQWVAGSDFSVPPQRTASIDVATTALGDRLVRSSSAGYRGSLHIMLKGYGYVAGTDQVQPRTLVLRN